MSFEMDSESNTESDDLNFHPPKDKDEEKEIEKWKQTRQNVWDIIKVLKEGNEGKLLWDELKEILLSNEKKLFSEYMKHVRS